MVRAPSSSRSKRPTSLENPHSNTTLGKPHTTLQANKTHSPKNAKNSKDFKGEQNPYEAAKDIINSDGKATVHISLKEFKRNLKLPPDVPPDSKSELFEYRTQLYSKYQEIVAKQTVTVRQQLKEENEAKLAKIKELCLTEVAHMKRLVQKVKAHNAVLEKTISRMARLLHR